MDANAMHGQRSTGRRDRPVRPGWPRPRLAPTLLMLGLLAVLPACRGDADLGGLEDKMDEASTARLQRDDTDPVILLSLHGGDGVPTLPDGITDLRRLGEAGSAILVAVAREDLAALAGAAGLERVVVWGGENAVWKLDPRLRNRMLDILTDGGAAEQPLSVVARFTTDAANLRAAVVKLGALPRSTLGQVMTIDAPVGSILTLLQLDELQNIELPEMSRPSARF